jgi:hypothetical protein
MTRKEVARTKSLDTTHIKEQGTQTAQSDVSIAERLLEAKRKRTEK